MTRPGADRILVLTAFCSLLIVLGFYGFAFNAVSSKKLGQVVKVEASATSLRGKPYADLLGAGALTETYDRFTFRPEELEFPATVFYGDAQISDYRDRRSREDRYRRSIAPRLDLRYSRISTGVRLEWSPNSRNEAIRAESAANPLLKTGYRIYRWRLGEEPKVIASGDLAQTRYVDEELGPRGGDVFYSVLTVLEGRIGTRDTVIESERSETLAVHLDDAYELRLVSGTTESAVIEVTVPTPSGPRTESFEVREGQTIGAIRIVSGQSIDFSTGLAVDMIAEVDTSREEVIRHPVFEADGSRSFNESGFVFSEEIRQIPVRRLEVQCSSERATPRVLSLDRS